jgi:hypothetical protein
MPIDVAKFRAWARIPHTADDPAIQIAWEAAVRELEERTGWCVDPVTRFQYVPVEPANEEKLIRLERQPVTLCELALGGGLYQILNLQEINGITYASLDTAAGVEYPANLRISAGSNTLNPLLEMMLLQRVAQHVQSRGDDTVPLSSDYFDRISAMMGKGIG